MKKLFLCTLLLYSCTHLFGQKLPEIVPFSPETSSLMKANEIPVSYYTGVPNISIPIPNAIQPLELSYNSSGIRVNEMASDVGLGWNLSAGGQITRIVKEKPDDIPNVGYIHSSVIVSDTTFDKDGNGQFINYTNQQILDNDLSSDEYRINIPGFSGMFMFNQDRTINSYGTVIQFPMTDYKIEPVIGGNQNAEIVSWVVTSNSGVQYYFGNSANTKEGQTESHTWTAIKGGGMQLPSPATYNPVNAWKLTKIVSPNGDETTFAYDKITYKDYSLVNEYIYGSSPLRHSTIYQEAFLYKARLKEISNRKGKVILGYTVNSRLDNHYFNALSTISIYDQNNILADKVEFEQDYFVSTVASGAMEPINFIDPSFDIKEENKRRLKLEKVIFKGASQQPLTLNHEREYIINYNETVNLPPRYHYAQDHWGYYNGLDASTTFIPSGKVMKVEATVYDPSQNPYITTDYWYKGSNRSIDFQYANANNIESIEHPTKGVTRFMFEANTFAHTTQNTIQGNQRYLYKQVDHAFTASNDLANLENANPPFDPQTGGPKYRYIKDLTIDILPFGEQIHFDAQTSLCTPIIGDLTGTCTIKFILEKEIPSGVPNIPSLYQAIATKNFPFDGNLAITETGNYRIVIEITNQGYNPSTQSNNTSVQLTWEAPECSQNSSGDYICNWYGGGVRVKDIKTFDSKTATAILTQKEYVYDEGYVLSPPLYQYRTVMPYYTGNSATVGRVGNLSSNSMIPLVSTKGGNVGYTKVTERSIAPSETIETEHLFTAHYTTSNSVDLNAHLQQNVMDWRRGNLLSSTNSVSKDSIQYFNEVVGANNYTYLGNVVTEQKIHNATFNPIFLENEPEANFKNYFVSSVENSGYGVEWRTFNLISGYTLPKKNINIKDNITTTQENKYGLFPDLFSPTISNVTNSTGLTLRTKTYYPDAVTSTTALNGDVLTTTEYQAIQQLQSANDYRIATPIQTESYQVATDGTEMLLSTQRNLFKQENSLVIPSIVQTAKGSGNLEDRIAYHRYDSYGNPLEVSKTGGAHISYIWGHNDTQPIAKIENASYDDIALALGISVADLLNYNETNMAQINGLRTSLSKAMVSTYTYQLLVGVTTMTDPRGYTTSYEYDEFNRLQYVKDADGNILSANEYNYRNQN